MYKINNSIDVPIYTQLVEMIRADILEGDLPYGAKLPTVRDLSSQCGVAPGTVMRVYEQLEQMGLAEKKQGKGTFVCYREHDEMSRKDKAMAAIDAMLDTLDELNFSESERSIYLNLKLREHAAGSRGLQLAVIECNNEILYQISEQLRGTGDVSVYSYQLDDIRAYPYQLAEDLDLIIVSASHAEELYQILPSSSRMVKAVLSLTPQSYTRIARIPKGTHVGIMCQSMRFGELLVSAAMELCENVTIAEPALFNGDVTAYLSQVTTLLIPRNYERFCSDECAEVIREYSKDHNVIPCEYRIDGGSMMYLEDKMRKLGK